MRNERITSRENPLVKRTAALLKSADARREEGLFICEGKVMLSEAADSGIEVESVFVLETEDMSALKMPIGARVYEVNQSVLEKISGVKTPQGVVFTCRIPHGGQLRGNKVIALENVSDPGNVGTIIRTSEAFGMDSVVFIGACADIYSPKVVRATMGSLFRMNACFMTLEEFSQQAEAQKLPVYGAALTEKAEELERVSLRKCAVMIGNEAKGLTAAALDKCDKHVIIPISGIQSLNAAVAASVFMYRMSVDK